MIIEYIKLFVFVFLLIYLHELGHWYCAKRDENYIGWGILPTPHIKLSKPFTKRVYYLSGLISSLLAFPFFYLFFWENNKSIYSILLFFGLVVGIAIIDIVIFILPKKLYLIDDKKEIGDEKGK